MNSLAKLTRIPLAILSVLTIATLSVGGYFFLRPNTNDLAASRPQQVTNDSDAQPIDAKSESSLQASDLDLHPQLKELKYDATIREIAKLEDPVVDGWSTERFSEVAGKQLKIVGKLLGDLNSIDASQVAKIGTPDFQGRLRPERLKEVFQSVGIRTFRSNTEGSGASRTNLELIPALREQAAVFHAAPSTRFKFKIIRVELQPTVARTLSYFQMLGIDERKLSKAPNPSDSLAKPNRVQVNATWECTWSLANSKVPKLTSIRVTDYEEVISDRPALFSDCTEDQFRGVSALSTQLIYGRDHWYANLESSIGVEGRGNGLAIGDANGDGIEDLYICQPAALPNKLLLRDSDGTFRDASAASGVDWLDSSRGALFVGHGQRRDQTWWSR